MTNKPPRAKKEIDGEKRYEEPGRGPIDTSSYAKERAGYGPQAQPGVGGPGQAEKDPGRFLAVLAVNSSAEW